ncbi:MAG: hypothetical protein JW723_09665 [Bacteroidales bacterium]|nr:hypothetical protein [Bacteroidales bacterium]
MKTKRFLTVIFTTAIFIAFLFTACEKNEVTVSDEDIEIAEDEAYVDLVFEDIMNEIDAIEAGTLKSTDEVCPDVTVTVIDTIWTITVDYGEGCEQLIYNRFEMVVDTVVRKGKVIIERKGTYRNEGSYRTVTLDNYSVNGIQIEGTRTIENMGLDQNLHMWFKIELQNGKITTPDGIEITRNSYRERHWVAGEATPSIWDDEYKIWGTVDGMTAAGEDYSCTIIDSLHVKMACRFIVGGQVEVVVGEREPIILDYGDGDCDALAALTRDGQSKQILLRFRPRLRAARVIRHGN